MNRYRQAVEQCKPRGDLAARLAAKMPGEAVKKRRVYRPRSLARKLLLAALLALCLTASVGAAAIALPWDKIFLDRFGGDAAVKDLAGNAFQEVNQTASCGDVTLTVRQALGDNKTIYLILDLQLPDTVNRQAIQAAAGSETDSLIAPELYFFATGDVPDIRGLSVQQARNTALADHRFGGGGSGSTESQGYDAKTNTLTYLVQFTTDSARNLTDQPLTLLVGSPKLRVNGAETALTNHPALVTFQPAYTAKAVALEARDDRGILKYQVSLSPFALSVTSFGGNYRELCELRRDACLVYRDGTVESPAAVSSSGGGSGSKSGDSEVYTTLSFHCGFRGILGLSTVKAIRVGAYELPLPNE